MTRLLYVLIVTVLSLTYAVIPFTGSSSNSAEYTIQGSNITLETRTDPQACLQGRDQCRAWFHTQLSTPAEATLIINRTDNQTYWSATPHPVMTCDPNLATLNYTTLNATVTHNQAHIPIPHQCNQPRIMAWHPYPKERQAALYETLNLTPAILTYTPAGLPLLELTIGNGSRTAYIISNQHASETYSAWLVEGIITQASTDPNLTSTTFKIIQISNPDGNTQGFGRNNPQGLDPNRQWNTNQDPTTNAIKNSIHATLPDLFIDVHGQGGTAQNDVIYGETTLLTTLLQQHNIMDYLGGGSYSPQMAQGYALNQGSTSYLIEYAQAPKTRTPEKMISDGRQMAIDINEALK